MEPSVSCGALVGDWRLGVTNVNLNCIAIGKPAHVAFGEQPIRKEG